MNEEQGKIVEVMGKPEFLKKLINQESIEKAQELFKKEIDVDLTGQDIVMLGNIINSAYEKGKITDKELAKISGGGNREKNSGEVIGAIAGAVTGGLLGLRYISARAAKVGSVLSGLSGIGTGLLTQGSESGMVTAAVAMVGGALGAVGGAVAGVVVPAAIGAKVGSMVGDGICEFMNL